MNILEQKLQKGVVIVAEIGKNFIQTEDERPVSEYLENARVLARAAKDKGADAVKFQTHNVEDEVLNMEFDSPHFKGKSRYQWVSRNERSTPMEDFWKPLKSYCDEIGIVFFSTPMSRGAAQKLQKLDVPFWKVASSDILDFVMLDFMVETGKTIIIPTGMSTLEDVDQSLNFLRRKNGRFVLMHAISRYPYPAEDSNLLTIPFFQKRFPGVTIGFSQNSPWVEPAIAAVALGARMVEQHFTFDRALWGPDHKVSMTPDEFSKMVRGIRAIENNPEKRVAVAEDPAMQKYMGTENKFLHEGEVPFRSIFRKSLMAGQDIPKGAIITADMIYAMRPQEFAGGLPSEKYEEVVGKTAQCAIPKFSPFTPDVLT
ncbi:MAG: hypothetical protein G01um101433_308 [Parcubacteria group bacterium Gr01-1014_33]|nr:MAG: hypothetical protein G01um101433_308 [Parcubacteria group bacterium Gr01-1014_33]